MATSLLSNCNICKMNVTPLLHNSKSFTDFHTHKKVELKRKKEKILLPDFIC